MAIYTKGIMGTFSGRVGNVIGSSWNSIYYLRSIPKPSTKPATAKQIAHRAKFAMVMSFLNPVRDIIKLGYYQEGVKKMSPFNRASQSLLKQIEGEYPDFIIPYHEIKFSKGSLGNISPRAERDINWNVLFTWSVSIIRESQAEDDEVYFILYHEEREEFYVFQDVKRADGAYTIKSDDVGTGEFHLWHFTRSKVLKKCSATSYCGVIEF